MNKSVAGNKTMHFFRRRSVPLIIEHLPCCVLSFLAGFVGVAFLHHNPVLELAFAIGGALIGEKLAHKFFLTQENCPCDDNHSSSKYKLKGYALAITIGVISWGIHQIFFH